MKRRYFIKQQYFRQTISLHCLRFSNHFNLLQRHKNFPSQIFLRYQLTCDKMSFVSLKEIEHHMTFLISIKITTRNVTVLPLLCAKWKLVTKFVLKNSNQHVRFTSRIQLLGLHYMILFWFDFIVRKCKKP